VRAFLKAVFDDQALNDHNDLGLGRAVALKIALGSLAERAPEPAIELLKYADGFAQVPNKAGYVLRHEVLGSPILFGVKANHEIGESVGFTTADDDAKETSDVSDEVDEDGSDSGDDTSDDEVAQNRRVSNGEHAAQFLRALAKWIDEPISERKKLVKRQLPLWVFLSAFERIPLYRDSAPQRLSLEGLVFDIGMRETALLDAVVAGFLRAALAKVQPSSDYRAVQHMNLVFRIFAAERKNSAHRKSGDQDALLVFMRKCHSLIKASGTGRETHVLRGAAKHMTAEDIAFVTQEKTAVKGTS
jgi:hypothetical protein